MLNKLIILLTTLLVFSCSQEEETELYKHKTKENGTHNTTIQTAFIGASNGYRTSVYLVNSEGELKETTSYKGTFAPKATAIEIEGSLNKEEQLLIALDYGDSLVDGGLCIGVIDNTGFMASELNCSVRNLIEFYLYNEGVAIEAGSVIKPGYLEFVTLDSKEALKPLVNILSSYIVQLNKNNSNRGIPIDSIEVVRTSIVDLLFKLNDGASIDDNEIYNFINNNSFGFVEKIDRTILIDPIKTQSNVKSFDTGGNPGVYIEQLPWVDVYRVFGDQQELGFTSGGFFPIPVDKYTSIDVVGMVGQYFTEDSSLVLNNNE